MTDLRRGVLVVLVCALSGCSECNAPPGTTYFERNIEPILSQKCVGNTSGCHSPNVGDPFQFSAGNLDLSSFAGVQKRLAISVMSSSEKSMRWPCYAVETHHPRQSSRS